MCPYNTIYSNISIPMSLYTYGPIALGLSNTLFPVQTLSLSLFSPETPSISICILIISPKYWRWIMQMPQHRMNVKTIQMMWCGFIHDFLFLLKLLHTLLPTARTKKVTKLQGGKKEDDICHFISPICHSTECAHIYYSHVALAAKVLLLSSYI